MLCHLTDKRVWVAGQHSIVGSAVMRQRGSAPVYSGDGSRRLASETVHG
jgi:hypothetical protein